MLVGARVFRELFGLYLYAFPIAHTTSRAVRERDAGVRRGEIAHDWHGKTVVLHARREGGTIETT